MSVSYRLKLLAVYENLLARYGRQAWWPAESPFEVMIGALLAQNTRWSNVEKALANLKQQHALTPEALLNLATSHLEDHLKPSGYFRIKAQRVQLYCRWYLSVGAYEGLDRFATSTLRELLLKVHGIGPETADDILLYAFHRPVFVIDSYTRRLLQRLQLIQGEECYDKLRAWVEMNLPKRVDLYQQYHALIVMQAKQHCWKNKPDCQTCALTSICCYGIKNKPT
ncbi:MAG: hypothetical protein RLZZ225_387 [Pseudomonadota bacterium]|jgi:endonuclease-3 related protein